MTARGYEGGNLLVDALAARGVERLFSVSGGPINSAYVATQDSPVQLVHVRHEAAAGFMADATSRATGVPGVALVTLGPGVTNTVTPAATAQLAGVPMLIVGGQSGTPQADKGAGMTLDTLPIMANVTSWAATVRHVERIPEYIDAAWRRMLAPTPGPVYLEIPADVLSAAAEPDRQSPGAHPATAAAAPDVVVAVAGALAGARRPLVIAGDDVRWSDAGAALAAFAEAADVPFVLSRLARGAVDETHHRCAGPGYLGCNPALVQALRDADVVVLLGHTFDFDLDFGAAVARDATVVQVHPDAAQIGRNVPATIAVTATARALLDLLDARPGDARDTDWVERTCAAWRRHHHQLSERAAQADGAMHPVALVEQVQSAMPPETTYVTSHGNIDFWADAQLQPTDPSRYLRAGQAGALGAEIPYGVAAQLARPDEPVVVFVGDGGFGYHCMELETAARYGAPVIVVIADDNRWGAIALPQRAAYGVEVEMALPRRDWAGLVTSIGGHGERVERPDEVAPALERARKAGVPAVVHAPVASVLSPYMDYVSR